MKGKNSIRKTGKKQTRTHLRQPAQKPNTHCIQARILAGTQYVYKNPKLTAFRLVSCPVHKMFTFLSSVKDSMSLQHVRIYKEIYN